MRRFLAGLKPARVKRLALLILLTVVLPFSALASESCHDLFSGHSQERAEDIAYYEAGLHERVSPVYAQKWAGFLKDYYTDFVKEVTTEKGKELEILDKMGFKFEGDDITVPPFDVFMQNYNGLLDAYKIPESKRIRPSVAFINRSGSEIVLVRPGLDEWPIGRSWGAKEIRLKARDMAKNVSEGRFPVFYNGIHDAIHLLIFARYPDYARALKKGFSSLSKSLTKGFMSRTAFAVEVLALANPRKGKELRTHMAVEGATATTTLSEFESAMEQQSPTQLTERANYWKEHYQSYLTHFGAGMREKYERDRYNSAVETSSSPSTLPNSLLANGMTHLDVVLIRRLDAFQLKPNDPESINGLRLALARTEYALWASATRITLKQWMADTMKPVVDVHSPTFNFIRDVFGEQSASYTLLSR